MLGRLAFAMNLYADNRMLTNLLKPHSLQIKLNFQHQEFKYFPSLESQVAVNKTLSLLHVSTKLFLKNPKPSTSFLQNPKPPYIYNLEKTSPHLHHPQQPSRSRSTDSQREPKIKRQKSQELHRKQAYLQRAIRNRYNSKVRKLQKSRKWRKQPEN